jgi:DNA-binding PadR family transcriptional regulator
MSQRTVRLLILSALSADSRHGSGIITEIGVSSAGRMRLRAGTLFTALYRLRAERLIAIDREEIVDHRLWRYYRLTLAGRERLAVTTTEASCLNHPPR